MPIQFNIDDNPNETIIEPQTLEVLDQVITIYNKLYEKLKLY